MCDKSVRFESIWPSFFSFFPSSTGRAVASTGSSLHNTLTLLTYLMTHSGAGLYPSACSIPLFSRQLITHRFRAMSCFYTPVIYQSKAGSLAVIMGRGVIFLCLYSDDVSHGSTPSPRIPYRVLGSAHCDHVHIPPHPPHPSLPRRSVPRAHKHTYTPVVSALPIQTADSGGSGRGKGGK